MPRILQFAFRPGVPLLEAESTLHLARFAAEGLAGPVRVHLDLFTLVDGASRSIFIDEGGFVGWMVSRIFAALVAREFGETAFEVRRGVVPRTVVVPPAAQEVAA